MPEYLLTYQARIFAKNKQDALEQHFEQIIQNNETIENHFNENMQVKLYAKLGRK